MLKAYLGFEIVLDKMELQTANTTGDAVELETLAFMLDFGRSEFESEADGYLNYAPAGFSQYRPAGQATSFVDDANNASERLNQYIEELGAISDSYEATVTTPTDFSSVQEKIDLLEHGLGWIEEYEAEIAEKVISATNALIDYLNLLSITIDDEDVYKRQHYTQKKDWKFSEQSLSSVAVFKLEVKELSCKEHL